MNERMKYAMMEKEKRCREIPANSTLKTNVSSLKISFRVFYLQLILPQILMFVQMYVLSHHCRGFFSGFISFHRIANGTT